METKRHKIAVNLSTSILHPHPKNPSKEDLIEITETLFKLFIENVDTYHLMDEAIEFMFDDVDTRDESTDEYKKAYDKIMQFPAYKTMLIDIAVEANEAEPLERWHLEYRPETGKFLQRFYYILERWDWNTTKEEMDLLNGTAEYYDFKEETDE